MPLTVIIISFPSPTLSFVPDLKPSFSANPSHCTLSFFSSCRLLLLLLSIRFYRAMLCIRGTIAMGLCPSVSVCVCLSVTSRCSTKTAKRRITQATPHDTPGTLVFWCQRSPRNSTGVTPYESAECRWGGQNRRLSANNRLYLENGKR